MHGEHLVSDRVVDGYGEGAAAHEEALEAGDNLAAKAASRTATDISRHLELVGVVDEFGPIRAHDGREPADEKGVYVMATQHFAIELAKLRCCRHPVLRNYGLSDNRTLLRSCLCPANYLVNRVWQLFRNNLRDDTDISAHVFQHRNFADVPT